MNPMMSPETMSAAAQLVIYFATIVAAFFSFLMTTRA